MRGNATHCDLSPLWLALLLAGGWASDASAQQVWRCGNSYRQAPCEGGQTVDLTPPLSAHPDPEQSDAQGTRPAAPERRHAPVAVEAPPRQHAHRIRERDPATERRRQCEQLETRVRRLDAEGRQGGSSQRMERIRQDRQQARDQQFRLGCR